jgi:hypothetical protein
MDPPSGALDDVRTDERGIRHHTRIAALTRG